MPRIITPGTWVYDKPTSIWKRHFYVLDVDVNDIYYLLFHNVPGFEIIEGKRYRTKQNAFTRHQALQPRNKHKDLAQKAGFKVNPFENPEGKSYYSEKDEKYFLTNDGIKGQVRISDHPLSLSTYSKKSEIDFVVEFIIPQKEESDSISTTPIKRVEGYSYILPSGRQIRETLINKFGSYIKDLLEQKVTYIRNSELFGIEPTPINESLTNDILLHITDGNYSDTNYYKTQFPEGYGCSMHKGKLTEVFYFDIRPINMTSRYEVYASSFLASQMDFNKGLPSFRLKTNAPMIWFEIPELRIFLNPSLKDACYGKNSGDFSVLGYGGKSYNDFLTEYVTDLFEYTQFFVLKKRGHRFNLV